MEPTSGHRPNILLVHGAFSDGSIWGQVIEPFNIRASMSLPARFL